MNTRHLVRLAATAAAALALLVAPAQSRAQISTSGCLSAFQCTLTELFAGGSIQVEDKDFRNWGLEKLDFSAGAAPNLNLITVGGLSSTGGPNTNQGIRFFGNGQLSVTGVQYLDLRLDFRVAVIPPPAPANQIQAAGPGPFLIYRNSTNLQAFSVVGGGAFIRFNGFLTNNTGSIGLGQLVLYHHSGFLPVTPAPTSDSIEFPPQGEVYDEKNFYLEGTQPGDSAQIDQLDQRFSQVPEPGELLMLGCGGAFLFQLSRRRARAAQHIRR